MYCHIIDFLLKNDKIIISFDYKVIIMFENLKEIKLRLLTEAQINDYLCGDTGMSIIEHPNNPLIIGSNALLKVNTNIGVSNKESLSDELEKLDTLSKLPYSPDSMMDHTIIKLEKPLWKYMVEMFDKPVGTLPHYSLFHKERGIDIIQLLETIDEMGESGISFMTFHPTATIALLEVAKQDRIIPSTSRGGVLLLKDAQINKRKTNIIVDYFDEILKICKKHHITISVGTAFRPACINEALDRTQLLEINEQKKYINYIKSKGVNTMMEGVGHLSLDKIKEYCGIIENINTPLMPLGPMPTDATIGFDHVTSAIGATVISLNGNVGIINSVTREEHTGGVPNLDSIIEGLKSARVAAHCINLTRFNAYRSIDSAISSKRALSKSCVISGGIFNNTLSNSVEGCSRCSFECPLSLLM